MKQSESLPINLFADGAYNRFEQSGFSSNTIHGSAIVSHKIRKEKVIISPYASAGYIRFSGLGEFKWTVGGDIQFGKIFVGAEHGRIRSSGTTYLRFGLKFGKSGANSISDNSESNDVIFEDTSMEISDDTTEERDNREAEAMEREQESQRIKAAEEAAENQRLADIKAAEDAEELRKQAQLKAEEEELEKQRLAQAQFEEQIREQNRLDVERAKEEQAQEELAKDERDKEEASKAAIANRGNFVIQFFASASSTRNFNDLEGLGIVFMESVNNNTLFRYLLGYYQTRNDAEQVKIQLRNLGYEDAFVKELK